MIITILGQTPSQKNSKNVGRNRYTGKTFVTSNKIVKDWQESALFQLRAVKEKFDTKVKIDYRFFVKDKRGRDLDNMIASVNDVLQQANADMKLVKGRMKAVKGTGIIAEDNWQHLEIGSAKAEHDTVNPRVEITITSL